MGRRKRDENVHKAGTASHEVTAQKTRGGGEGEIRIKPLNVFGLKVLAGIERIDRIGMRNQKGSIRESAAGRVAADGIIMVILRKRVGGEQEGAALHKAYN